MPSKPLRFICATDDPDHYALYKSYASDQRANPFGQVRNDKTIAFTVEPVISNPPSTIPIFAADFEDDDTFQVAIGLPDQPATGGTFNLTVAGSSTNLTGLAYNVSAAALQTPFNAAMAAHGPAYPQATITLTATGVYRIIANTNGAIPSGTIETDAGSLFPSCSVTVLELSLGDTLEKYILELVVKQTPFALATPTTLLDDITISASVTQSLSATAQAINQISFNVDPVSGTFNLSAYALGVTQTCGTPYGYASADDLQTALETHPKLSGNVSVSKNGNTFIINFTNSAGPKNIISSSVESGATTIITTNIPHGYTSGMTVTHSGTNSTPNTDGAQVVTVLTDTTYSVPVDVTTAGTAGITRDSTSPSVSVTNIDLKGPKGVSGTINLNTQNLYEYSVTNSENTTEYFSLYFSITRTRVTGERKTIFGPTPIQISKDIVDPVDMVPAPLASYLTETESDARYFPYAGVTDASNAAAGKIGEFSQSLISTGSATSLTTATAKNVTSISLSAGDWDVEGNINFNLSGATQTASSGGISTTSATLPTDGSEVASGVVCTTTTLVNGLTLPRKRINVSTTTTVYLVAKATFSAGTEAAWGKINARRVR